jgi:uncharacterized protein involved in exopolysaccharide biosynthesis
MAAKGMTKTERSVEEAFEFGVPVLSEERRRDENKIETARLLWSQRTFVLRASAIGLLLALLIAIVIPNRYTSTVRLMPPDQESGMGMGMLAMLAGKATASLGSLGGLGQELLGLKTNGDLFIGILRSRTVENAIVNKFDLRKVYGDKRWETARKDLESHTTVSQDRKSGILTIDVSDRSSRRAQEIAEEYVTQLNLVVINLNTSSAHRERVFLEERLKGVDQDLNLAQRNFSQFASKNTTIDIQSQGKAMIEAGAMLAGQLVAAQTELEGLRQIYADGNVRVREAQARVEELQRQLQKLGGTPGSNSPTGFDSKATASDSKALFPPIRELPLLGVTYADLFRQVKTQEAIFEFLTQQYELAKVQEAKETPSVKVLDIADLPEKKSFPPRAAIVIIGTMLTCALACGVVIGRSRWEKTNPHNPNKALIQEMISAVRQYWHSRTWEWGRNGERHENH